MSFSVARDYTDGRLQEGPLFKRIASVFDRTLNGDAEAFEEMLLPDAALSLRRRYPLEPVEFNGDLISAATHSCMGPFPYDEGETWTQFSWVCRVDEEAAVAKFLKFQDSPELTFTVWFEGDRIRKVIAGETLPTPNILVFQMNAVPTDWKPE